MVGLVPRLLDALRRGQRRHAAPPRVVLVRLGRQAEESVAGPDGLDGDGRAQSVVRGVEVARLNVLDPQLERVAARLGEYMRHHTVDESAGVHPDAARAIDRGAV